MRPVYLLLVLLLCLQGLRPAPARAQTVEVNVVPDAPEKSGTARLAGYPLRLARRPLVLDQGMLRADSRIFLGGERGPGIASSLDLGGAFSPTRNLELGLSSMRTGSLPAGAANGLISVLMSPDAAYGDIPLYGRYQFRHSEVFAAAAELILTLPSRSNFTLTLGLPMRVYELFGLFTLDSSVSFSLRAGDAYAEQSSDPSDISFDLGFEGSSSYNITDRGFLQIGGGLRLVNMNGGAGAKNVIELPFFIGGGYSHLAENRPIMADFFVQAGWLPLMFAHAPDGVDTFEIAETWFLTFGAQVYTEPLFQKKR